MSDELMPQEDNDTLPPKQHCEDADNTAYHNPTGYWKPDGLGEVFVHTGWEQ